MLSCCTLTTDLNLMLYLTLPHATLLHFTLPQLSLSHLLYCISSIQIAFFDGFTTDAMLQSKPDMIYLIHIFRITHKFGDNAISYK